MAATLHVRLGTVACARGAKDLATAMGQWRNAIDAVPEEKCVRAIELYGGGIWGNLRQGEWALREQGVAIRIVSAGLGLLSPDDKVPGYDATFAPGGRNSIGGARGATVRNRQWWRLLGEWIHPAGEPRSIAATIRKYSNAAHVLALPSDYMDAVLEDFHAIEREEACLKRTVVLVTPYWTARCRIPGAVIIPGDLYAGLGGTRGTVLARAGLYLATHLKGQVIDAAATTRALAPLHAQSRPLPVRTQQSDAKVSQFIRRELRTAPSAGHTTLLARYRANGFACEYTRFRKLHRAVLVAI